VLIPRLSRDPEGILVARKKVNQQPHPAPQAPPGGGDAPVGGLSGIDIA